VNLLSKLFCEDLGLRKDALRFFARAKELAPSIKEYDNILDKFRERKGMEWRLLDFP